MMLKALLIYKFSIVKKPKCLSDRHGVKNYRKYYTELLLENTTLLPEYSIQNQMHFHQEGTIFFWFTNSLHNSNKNCSASFQLRRNPKFIQRLMESHFFGLKPKASTCLLQNSVFLSFVIYFQKPKGTSTYQAWNFVSTFNYWFKCCSCLVQHKLFDWGTGTLSWPKAIELLLYVGSKTIQRVNTMTMQGILRCRWFWRVHCWRVCVLEMFQTTVSMLKEGCFSQMSVIWMDTCPPPSTHPHAHTHTHTDWERGGGGFSVLSALILSFCPRPFRKLPQIYMFK
jgi:hypothetical protein